MKCKIYLIASLVVMHSSWIQSLPYIMNQYNRNQNGSTAEPEVKYLSYYIYPTRLLSGAEKRETAGKALIPELAITKTETVYIPQAKGGRQATKITFDIQKTMNQLQKQPIDLPVDADAPIKFNIQQRLDNNNNPVFIMQLPKHYLAKGIFSPFNQQWGPWWKDIKDFGDYWEFVLRYDEVRPQKTAQPTAQTSS